MVVLRVLAFGGGVAVALWVLMSALRTVVVPRGERVLLTSLVFAAGREVTEAIATRVRSDEATERIRAWFAPTALALLPAAWAMTIAAAFVPMYWAVGVEPFREALVLSGSSLTTLGFSRPNELPAVGLAVVEGFIGLGLVALLISYLPSMYSHFSHREHGVAKFESWAGSPPTPVEMLTRAHAIGWLDRLDDTWANWEDWFIEVEETHTSFPALVFFRSPEPARSWVTTAGAALDTAAISASVVNVIPPYQASLCIRSGYLALRNIADFYGIAYDPDPAPDDPISITREEFDTAYEELAVAGVPVRPDRNRAWRDFAGWRVNYDTVLIELCSLVNAPAAPWSADRAPRRNRHPFFPSRPK